MTFPKQIQCAAALLLHVQFAGPVYAEDDMQAAPELSYYVVQQPIVQFFSQLERDTGIQIDTTEGVNGMIRDTHLEGSVSDVLTRLSNRHDLQWFAFNGVHYVSAQSEARMRLVRLGDVPSDVAKAVLEESGLMSERFPVADAAQGTAVALTGPPKLLGLSEAVIETVVVEPTIVPTNKVIVRRGVSMSIESHDFSDIAARVAAQAAAQNADTSSEGDS